MVLIVLLLLAYSVSRILYRIWRTYQCPHTSVITDFWRGRLSQSTAEYQHLISHLGICEQCQERLHRLRKGLPIEDHLIE